MTVFTADVTGVSQAFPTAFFIYLQRADGATEHVTGVGESQQHVVKQTETAVVTIRHKMPHHLLHLTLGVQRFDLIGLALLLMRVLAVDLLIVRTDILLLNKSRVGKHECT